RNGLDVAKAVALGANLCALGQPLLEPAMQSVEAVKQFLQKIIFEIRVAMFCAGAKDIEALRKSPLVRRA
ncbi:MAG: alpha-hydroxy-acid oxidizing protein, partial [Candidatus Binatia bacterium]